jgi:hypothetical protein
MTQVLWEKGDTVTIAIAAPILFKVSEKVSKNDGSYSITAISVAGERLLMSVDGNALYGSIAGETVSYTISTDA